MNENIDPEYNDNFIDKLASTIQNDQQNTIDDCHILGFTPDGAVLLWKKGVLSVIRSKDLTQSMWVLLTGHIYDKDEFAFVKDQILSIANMQGAFTTTNGIGSGIIKNDNAFYIINGNELIKYLPNVHKFIVKDIPIIGSNIVQLTDQKWINKDNLIIFNDDIEAKQVLYEAFMQTYNLVTKWTFENDEYSKHLSAFILLAPFSTLMKWKPIVYIIGRRGVGKTTFLDMLESLYPNLTVRLDKTTAFAIAQRVGNTAKIPILDEFENDKHILDILNLLKNTTGREGGVITRGTVSTHAKTYYIKQMFWLASIYTPSLLDAAISSRVAFFTIKGKTSQKFFLPSIEEIEELKHKIVSVMMYFWDQIEARATEYRKDKALYQDIQDGRLIDNYSYSSAVIDLAGLEGGIPAFVQNMQFNEDEIIIIDTILSSKIRTLDNLGSIWEGSVAQALTDNISIENYGIKITEKNNKKYLALKTDIITRFLLKDTPFKEVNVGAALSRLSGVLTNQAIWMDKRTAKALFIPYELTGLEEKQTTIKNNNKEEEEEKEEE